MAKIICFLLAFSCVNGEIVVDHPPINPSKLKQLAEIGIDLTFIPPPPLKKEIPFLSGFKRKGAIYKKWLQQPILRPKRVIEMEN